MIASSGVLIFITRREKRVLSGYVNGYNSSEVYIFIKNIAAKSESDSLATGPVRGKGSVCFMYGTLKSR